MDRYKIRLISKAKVIRCSDYTIKDDIIYPFEGDKELKPIALAVVKEIVWFTFRNWNMSTEERVRELEIRLRQLETVVKSIKVLLPQEVQDSVISFCDNHKTLMPF